MALAATTLVPRTGAQNMKHILPTIGIADPFFGQPWMFFQPHKCHWPHSFAKHRCSTCPPPPHCDPGSCPAAHWAAGSGPRGRGARPTCWRSGCGCRRDGTGWHHRPGSRPGRPAGRSCRRAANSAALASRDRTRSAPSRPARPWEVGMMLWLQILEYCFGL